MSKKKWVKFSPEFRLETAQLLIDQGYIQKEVSEAMNVGFSIGGHWISTIPKHYVALCETS